MNYLALGDSISIDDYTDVEGGGAVNQFARLIRADQVEDFTQDGRTTAGVLADLERVTLTPNVVTLTAGGNDFLQAVFRHAAPTENVSPDYWPRLVQPTLANLTRIAERLAQFHCPVILNTVYDPTDGDNALFAQIGVPPPARQAFDALNKGIIALAQTHGFLLSDLETLFHGHGLRSQDCWFIMNIEPDYAGATAIAAHWFRLLRAPK